jgi:phage protein U
MTKIGSFGGVSFVVKNKKVLTFTDSERTTNARWGSHDLIGRKPLPEFIGPDLAQFSMTVVFSIYQGVNPGDELKKLRAFCESGKVGKFVLGKLTVSKNQWRLTKLTESNREIDQKGRLCTVVAEMVLEEYPKSAKKKTTKPKPKKKTSQAASKKTSTGTITIKVGMLNCRSSTSLKAHIVKVLRKNQKYKVYGKKTTDITWYNLGGSKWCSASSKYVSFGKG